MRHLLPPIITIALLAGCTAGPDYAGPPEVVSADTGARFVRAGSDVSASDPVVAQWWLLLGDPELTQPVQGFAALPFVDTELAAVNRLKIAATLRDESRIREVRIARQTCFTRGFPVA